MKEIFKDIEGYEGLYQVSNLGRVKSLEREVKCGKNGFRTIKEKNLNVFKVKTGHLSVDLYKNSKCKKEYIHSLVLKTFLEILQKEWNAAIIME